MPERTLTPMQAIRKNCLACMGGSYTEVKNCTSPDCDLLPYRFGRRPAGSKGAKRKPKTTEQEAVLSPQTHPEPTAWVKR